MTAISKEEDENVYILTVYTPHEANYYLLDEYLKNPTKAKVLKTLKYDKPPVVKIKDLELESKERKE